MFNFKCRVTTEEKFTILCERFIGETRIDFPQGRTKNLLDNFKIETRSSL